MTTAADLEALVAPVLARQPDLILVKRHLVITPIGHIVRGVHLGRQSDKAGLRPFWAADLLARPDAGLAYGLGDSWFPNAGHYFSTNQPDLASLLAAAIEDFALPTLRPVASINEFRRYASDGTIGRRARLDELPFYKICVDIALGNLESAASICMRFAVHDEKWRKAGYGDEIDMLALLRPLVLANDRAALAALLHQWEAAAVKRLNLEGLWEPSPFPLEEIA